jgi:hypothetical protein
MLKGVIAAGDLVESTLFAQLIVEALQKQLEDPGKTDVDRLHDVLTKESIEQQWRSPITSW